MTPWLVKYGDAGVILFFVISGFLISGILMDTPDIKRFYIRRFLRILPIYYLLVIILRPGAKDFWWVVTYTHNWITFIPEHNISHFWSLCVEEQFYLIWPWLVVYTPNAKRVWLFTITIATSLMYKATLVYLDHKALAIYGTLGCMDQLSLGALTAWMLRNTSRDTYARYLKTVLLLGAIPFIFIGSANLVLWKFVIALICVPLVGSSVFPYPPKLQAIFRWAPLQYAGRISYGLYLYHLPVWHALPWMSYRHTYGYWVCWLAYLVATFAVASLSWYAFERPINNLKRFFPYRPAP